MNEHMLLKVSNDPAAFRRELLIERAGSIVRLGDCLDDWQERDFAALDPAWRVVAGLAEDTNDICRRSFIVRPRGHSKSSDQAIMALWAMAFSDRRLSGILAAADGDQAALILDAAKKAMMLNEWLEHFVSILRDSIKGIRKDSTAKIITSDVGSSFGHRPDFITADELCHWGVRGEELWGSLLSAAAKNPLCILQAITNAGTVGSWQWKLFESVRESPGWHVASLTGSCASWIKPEDLDEQKRLLPPTAYRRLWLNEWVTGGGDALEEESILAAIDPDLTPMTEHDSRYVFAAGLDLGLAKDASALVVIAREIRTGRFRLASVRRWKPTKNRKVDLTEVEAAVIEDTRKYRLAKVALDPWQGAMLAERLRKAGVPAEEFHLHVTAWDTITRNLIEVFQNGAISLYDNARLIAELKSGMIQERSNGQLKILFPRDEHGHGDVATAFLIALEVVRQARAPVHFRRPQGYGTRVGTVRDDIERNSLMRESMSGSAGSVSRKE